MNRLPLILVLTMTMLLGSSGVCWSADFLKGFDAAERGDYATALKEWTPLAEQGDADAQSNLGVMYDNGAGVPQDDKAAVGDGTVHMSDAIDTNGVSAVLFEPISARVLGTD